MRDKDKSNDELLRELSELKHKNESLTSLYQKDLSELNRIKSELKYNEIFIESLIKISQYNANTIQEFLDYALDEVIKLTRSKIGYIYFYDENKEEFTLNTWSKDVMKECSVLNPQTIYQLEKTGIWGEVVRQRKNYYYK